ncbi:MULTISPECIES: AIPR family protein [unclassified Pseudomonas]|uniref:AIPR family protein n=1 Tax=unclassified Pseudomonas TaxID=196821 RepID=UPI002117ABB9|nr:MULTISPECIES: AIPR family protein [unclassified Pseudomonas]
MDINDLKFQILTSKHLKPYAKRSPTETMQFLKWILENIFRLDAQDADDACVDMKQDKGVDALLINDTLETIYIFQSKFKNSDKSTLGDTDLKEFTGTLAQFQTPETIDTLLAGKAHEGLKATIRRINLKEKIEAGYSVEGVFCTNASLNSEGIDYLKNVSDITVYDANKIVADFIDIDADAGVNDTFEFNTSDTEIIDYQTSDGVTAKIFLANALQLTHMKGISDSSLFSRNVRFSLGNTKVNKSLLSSIKDKKEHKNFPLYHNGITVLCDHMEAESEDKLSVTKYMVVNGAQSLTSLLNAKSSISADLKVLVKVIALGGDEVLTDKITQNSNNQNAIKARDMRSNHGIQQRLKKEVSLDKSGKYSLQVKQGEVVLKGSTIISNENAGLALLALDLGEPWSCHQKYKVMDDSYSKIFGRSDVTGAKIIGLYLALDAIKDTLDSFDDQLFGNYTLTRYFLGYVVSEIIKDDPVGKNVLNNIKTVLDNGKLQEFLDVFTALANTTVSDLNAEVDELRDNEDGFDYKRDLKSQKWCKNMCSKLRAAYIKDVKRKKADPVSKLLADML